MLENSIITHNTAANDGSGAGLWNAHDVSMRLIDTTVSFNTGSGGGFSGGGIFSAGYLEVRSSTIDGNVSG